MSTFLGHGTQIMWSNLPQMCLWRCLFFLMRLQFKAVLVRFLHCRVTVFPDSSGGKESACNAGDPGFNSWVWKIHWRRDRLPTPVFLGFPYGSAGKESTCNVDDPGSLPGLGRAPEEGKGYPLQYSNLENSMDCVVQGVAKSWTWLSDFHFQAGSRTKRGSSPSRRRLTGYSAPHAHLENCFTNEGTEVKITSLVKSVCASTSEAETRTPVHHYYDLQVILCDHWLGSQGLIARLLGTLQGESSHDSQASVTPVSVWIPAQSAGSILKALAFQLIVKWQSGCGESKCMRACMPSHSIVSDSLQPCDL